MTARPMATAGDLSVLSGQLLVTTQALGVLGAHDDSREVNRGT